jgi:hypothetical protein
MNNKTFILATVEHLKKLLILLAVSLPLYLQGSHIVGGEFELVHKENFIYTVRLILYFDVNHGSPGARDTIITSAIYRKSDNRFMMLVKMPLISETRVSYTQPKCSKGEIITNKMVYSADIALGESTYTDPQGYYLSWQRCCRNYEITNIYSEKPSEISKSAGQTFYLEFPPVVKNGFPFINSSPILFPPLNDYACPGRPYYADFAGTDPDGDSLVYSLVTPLSTTTTDAFPPNSPAPYPEVIWRPGFSLDKITKGLPDLKISPQGLVTVTPADSGLYVFAVRCEQFRDGIKIGESRRDFQMLVLDFCTAAEPPVILGKKITDATFAYQDDMAISFDYGSADNSRCIRVQVTDPDSKKSSDRLREKISLRVVPLNFRSSIVSEVLPLIKTATLVDGSAAEFDICFPECPYFFGGAYQLGIIAMDDACSIPLTDTLRVEVTVNLPANQKPVFSTPDVSASLIEGDVQVWPVAAFDPDGDTLIISRLAQGFVPENSGMVFNYTYVSPSQITGQFLWDTHCDVYDFSTRSSFLVELRADDRDVCNAQREYGAMKLNLNVSLPKNDPPIIDSNLDPGPSDRRIIIRDKKVFDLIDFQVSGADQIDHDSLELILTGVDFDPAFYEMNFPAQRGRTYVSSDFNWLPGCDNLNLNLRDEFDLRFILIDRVNKCRVYKADTLDVILKINPPDNTAPELIFSNVSNEVMVSGTQISAKTDELIQFRLTGTDTDKNPVDQLKLNLIQIEGTGSAAGASFAPATGTTQITSEFIWRPDCSAFGRSDWTATFKLTFLLADDKCFNVLGDTVVVDVALSDPQPDEQKMMLPNIVTPNGDGLNEVFILDREDGSLNEIVGLPKDNCSSRFEEILIYNRWGKPVFESTDRYFNWQPPAYAEGVYYYNLKYTLRLYKGTVTVTR